MKQNEKHWFYMHMHVSIMTRLPPTSTELHLSKTSKTWSFDEKFRLSFDRSSNIKLQLKRKTLCVHMSSKS